MSSIAMFVDIARENPDVILTLSQRAAEEVVGELARRNLLQTDVLVQQVMNSGHSASLLAVIVRNLTKHPDELRKAALALYELDDDMWGSFDRSDFRQIADLLNRVNLFGLLAEGNLQSEDVLKDADHPLFSLLSSDAYWDGCLHRLLRHGDHARAWDTAKHALRGYLPKGTAEPSFQQNLEGLPEGYTHQVSIPSFGQMVKAVFTDMSGKGLVAAAISDTDCLLDSFVVETRRYQSVMRRGGRNVPRPAKMLVDQAGRRYAELFILEDRGIQVPKRYTVAPEAVMVLRIAGYFAEKETAKSRAKWVELCKKHGVDPATLDK